MIIITDNDGSHDLSVQMAGTKDEVKMPEVGARRAGPKTSYIVSSSLKQLLSFPLVFSDLLVVDLTRCRCIWRRNCLHLKPVGYSRPVDFSTFIFFFSKCIVSKCDCLPQVGRPLDDLWHCYFCDHYLVSLVTTHITERNGTAMY